MIPVHTYGSLQQVRQLSALAPFWLKGLVWLASTRAGLQGPGGQRPPEQSQSLLVGS